MIRSTKEIKRKLLSKAIKEGRGPQMILLIQWRLEKIRNDIRKDFSRMEEMKNLNISQPRSVKMLNILSKLNGLEERFVYIPKKHISKGTNTIN